MCPTRRQAILRVSPEFLVDLLSTSRGGQTFCIRKGLPKDVKLRGAYFDGQRNTFNLVLESPRFESVPVGRPLPMIDDPVIEGLE